MRTWRSFPLHDPEVFRVQLLNYSNSFTQFVFLDNCNNAVYGKPAFDLLLAAGTLDVVQCKAGKAFENLQQFTDKNKDWCFGHLGYDLKNETEELTSVNPDGIQMDDLVFFVPQILIIQKNGVAEIGLHSQEHDAVFDSVTNSAVTIEKDAQAKAVTLHPRISKENWLEKIEQVKRHIAAGDVYELNLCQEFYAEHVHVRPLYLFNELCKTSQAPFSAFYRWHDKYLLSASPERFLRKQANRIISMPIKGTIRKSSNAEEDAALKAQLAGSEKDRAENVMIVDLVRNDLTRSAVTGTIQVDELFGIYSFAHVHHMISTVSARVKPGRGIAQILKNTFPMGSMTGAPKVMAMQLAENYEERKRGLYSGALGYITPEGDFDFNVVIRSILFNKSNGYLSVHTGGAIVYDSVPEEEYAECLLKLKGIEQVLAQ